MISQRMLLQTLLLMLVEQHALFVMRVIRIYHSARSQNFSWLAKQLRSDPG